MLIWYCDFHSNTGSPVGYPVEISVKRSQGSYPWDVVINVVMGDLAKQNSAPEEWRFAISTFQSGLCSGATWCQEGCSKIFHLFSPWRIPKAYFWWEKHVMSRQSLFWVQTDDSTDRLDFDAPDCNDGWHDLQPHPHQQISQIFGKLSQIMIRICKFRCFVNGKLPGAFKSTKDHPYITHGW